MFGELLVVAGAAVHVTSFGEEALRPDWSFTVEAGEALVVPRVAFVLHTLCACRRREAGEESVQTTGGLYGSIPSESDLCRIKKVLFFAPVHLFVC